MKNQAFNWDQWGRMDGLAIAGHVRNGEVSAREVAQQAAHAIALVDPAIESSLEVFMDLVAKPESEGSRRDGVLFGVPVVLKDLAARLKGRVQESGSALFRDQVAAWTDPFIANLLDAGLIPLGRSTTAEMGLAWDTSTTHRGQLKVSRNPYDLQRTPGGSSGGSAALVSAGAVPIGTSSDGGGSTRIPASHCGLVGLKPTRGLCPRPLDSSEYISRISTDGVVTRSVRDTAAVLDYTARVRGGASFMPVSSGAGSYLGALQMPRERIRVAWSDGHWGRKPSLTADAAAKLGELVSLVSGFNCDIVDVAEEEICHWDELWDSYTTNWISSRGQLELIAAQRGLSASDLKSLLTPMVYRMYEASAAYDKFALWQMMTKNNWLTRQYGALFERIDVLITPVYAGAVPLANGPSSTVADGDVHEWFSRQLDAAKYAILCNEVGAPAISVPVGLGSDGLPIGVQLCGRWGDERKLLQLAADIEYARPHWFSTVPAAHVTHVAASA